MWETKRTHSQMDEGIDEGKDEGMKQRMEALSNPGKGEQVPYE